MKRKPGDFSGERGMSDLRQGHATPSTWFGGLKRLAVTLLNPQTPSGSALLSTELCLLNLGKRAQPTGLYSPADVNEAAARYRANCGPAAFAAITRCPVSDVMMFFGQFPEKPWTTKAQMRAALNSANLEWRDCGASLPGAGLALVQLLGPWCRPGIHPGAALSRTHWIAVTNGAFYDINWEGWLPQDIWEQLVFVGLRDRYRGCSGWAVHAGCEVQAPTHSQESFVQFPDAVRRKVADLQPA